MPAPRTGDDEEPGRRPPWWRRALSAVLRTIIRGVTLGRRGGNERGSYRSLGREWRENRRAGMNRRQALRAT